MLRPLAARVDSTTLVSISERGFRGSPDEVVAQALDSTGGFTIVLAGLKALLEHQLALTSAPRCGPPAMTGCTRCMAQ
ncbi:MAG: hypothetical protein H8E31_05200 [Planctomycetes bacterium]|nr:hypothetical protein [Planctomycetota bacterium]